MKAARHKIAVLVDLPATAHAGGHVKMWLSLAEAAARSHLPIDLTVYFSGAPRTAALAPHVRALHIPPVFSTAKLTFLPYLPDHTDLAGYHAQLARHLRSYDLVHTTDAFFAFAQTVERMQRRAGYALVHSFHTDQPAYAAIFLRRSLEAKLGRGLASRALLDGLRLPALARQRMLRRQRRHLRLCDHILAIRPDDKALAERYTSTAQVSRLRLGVDRTLFRPDGAQRAALCTALNIPNNRLLILFVGRLDEGKNIYPLIAACRQLRQQGYAPHLLAAGIGPAAATITSELGDHATLCGFLQPEALAKLYAGCDLLAIPSEVEIGSLVLIEALASGLPVLVSANSQLATLHGPSAALEPAAQGAEAWAAALQNVMTTSGLLPDWREAACAYSRNRIADWNSILREDLFPAWEQALARRAQAPAAMAA